MTDGTIIPCLKQRWSPRAFADTNIDDETLRLLFEASRWAPSCYNDQPWSFVFSRRDQDASYAPLLATLIEFNQSWAATAPVLVFGCTRETFERNGEPNRHAWYDLGQAVGHLLAQASELGIQLHQMAGFDTAAAAAAIGVPSDVSVVVAAALGYPGDPARLPEGIDEKDPAERERKGLSTFVFRGEWSNAVF